MVFLSYELPPKKDLSYFMTDFPTLFLLKNRRISLSSSILFVFMCLSLGSYLGICYF